MSKPAKKKAIRHYSRKLIHDEFTALNLSRRRKYQLRRVQAGLCVKCSHPPVPGSELCLQHRIADALASQKRRNSPRPHKGKWLSLAKTAGHARKPARQKSA
jgi:hypothetical protein